MAYKITDQSWILKPNGAGKTALFGFLFFTV